MFDVERMESAAKNIRRRVIRLTGTKGVGHTGGSLSMVEILTALYFGAMRYDARDPRKPDRDRFVLSKGHATPGYYGALCEAGFFAEEDLFEQYDEINGHFQGHPDMTKTPGVDMSTGSLGQGLSAAIGMALGLARDGLDSRVYALLGDGEMQEGQVWEAVSFAGAKKVKNIIAILDNNRLQLTGRAADVLDLNPFAPKIEAFGWRVIECDGHDLAALSASLAKAVEAAKDGPVFIVANTVKGKGVSFIENKVEWHSKSPSREEMAAALKELE